MEVDEGLAQQQETLSGTFASPSIEWFESELILAVVEQPLSSVRRRLRPSGSTIYISVRFRRGRGNRGRPTPSWAFLGKVVSAFDSLITH